jgi:hypothetical protein
VIHWSLGLDRPDHLGSHSITVEFRGQALQGFFLHCVRLLVAESRRPDPEIADMQRMVCFRPKANITKARSQVIKFL